MRLNADMGEDAERLWDLKAFTNNLVIGHPLRQDGGPELGQVLMDIAALQLNLARQASSCAGAPPSVRSAIQALETEAIVAVFPDCDTSRICSSFTLF
jgi:hypothetical protein